MSRLSDHQATFAAALCDPGASTPGNLSAPDGTRVERRFAVYRNNVLVGLVEVVAGAFPAVKKLVGDEFFSAMARVYVSTRPPASPVLMDYGADFAEFISSFEPAASVPYLADVARIERAWREAYHAAEATPFGPDDFAAIAEDDLPAMTLDLHPSLRTVRSDFPACTIWSMNTGHESLVPIDLDQGGEDTLIVRPSAEVGVRRLPPGGSDFLAALAAGQTLDAAATSAMAAVEQFDLAGNIAGLIDSGGVVGYSVPR